MVIRRRAAREVGVIGLQPSRAELGLSAFRSWAFEARGCRPIWRSRALGSARRKARRLAPAKTGSPGRRAGACKPDRRARSG